MPLIRLRLGVIALVLAAVMFILYPVTRPWHDETTVAGATAAMSSGWWVASHLFAIIGFILVPLGLLAVRRAVAATPAEPMATAATVTMWLGVGLTLPYYGAEDFGLHAAARLAATGSGLDLLELVEAIRFQPVAVTTFGLGLLLVAAGAILVAVAVPRSGVMPRWSGVPFAVGFALFLPQFFAPPAVRIAHGVLVAAGLLWMALSLRRAGVQPDRATSGPDPDTP
jgi:hypothetical protein